MFELIYLEIYLESFTFQGHLLKAAAKNLFRQKYNGSRGRGRFYADRQKYNIYLRKK